MTQIQPIVNTSVLSVSSLNRLVRDCLEASFPLTWVGGEISNLTYAASGHVYFSLKDAGAQVRCVMWRNKAQTLGWRLENGQKVEARALVSFYEPRGEFQLNIESLRQAGQGDLFERFMRLKAQLEQEGLFASDKKRPPPAFPRRLAIVSSLQAAALRDVLSTLHRRAPHLIISLYPTPVQGDGAGPKIADAISQASQDEHDVLIVCRGGGSIEDLWAFNEECVARAIAAASMPVISGVGHETDFTIADFAADVRAPTPTAAAELASPDSEAWQNTLAVHAARINRIVTRHLENRAQQLDTLANRLVHPAQRLADQEAHLNNLALRLTQSTQRQIDAAHLHLRSLQLRRRSARPNTASANSVLQQTHQRLQQQGQSALVRHRTPLDILGNSLKQLDPHAVLQRGYAIAIGPNGRAVRKANELLMGDRLTLHFGQGTVSTSVTQVVAPPEAD